MQLAMQLRYMCVVNLRLLIGWIMLQILGDGVLTSSMRDVSLEDGTNPPVMSNDVWMHNQQAPYTYAQVNGLVNAFDRGSMSSSNGSGSMGAGGTQEIQNSVLPG